MTDTGMASGQLLRVH